MGTPYIFMVLFDGNATKEVTIDITYQNIYLNKTVEDQTGFVYYESSNKTFMSTMRVNLKEG